ncbi:MAG: hypothetical protein V1836_02085 [Candidatus Aenigmatarchaeota archaeon]
MTTESRHDHESYAQPFSYGLANSAPPIAITCTVSLKLIEFEENDLVTGAPRTIFRYEKICNTRVAECAYRKGRENDEPLCTYSRELVDTLLERLNKALI